MYRQGDIINVYFQLPNQTEVKTHPAVILSCDETFHIDELYVCAMITSKAHNDIFEFEIEDDMLDIKLPLKSYVRCHLISFIEEKQIKHQNPKNRMSEEALMKLTERINTITFSTDNYDY